MPLTRQSDRLHSAPKTSFEWIYGAAAVGGSPSAPPGVRGLTRGNRVNTAMPGAESGP